MSNEIPTYTVSDLNDSIGILLNRGFAPRFLLNATISKCQLKKGHLWMTLTDGNASIDAVVWSSRLKQIKFRPKEDDGVLIIGKLNFWTSQARLSINVLDVRPTISTVLRQFELVKNALLIDGLIDESKRRKLPRFPNSILILTSVPSSALADMLRTCKERWPLTKLFIVPIPVQGEAIGKVQLALKNIKLYYKKLKLDAVILARGGGSREDLMFFDNEIICRELALLPIPLITGIGHEDDLTVADLVADHRSATPTAAIVDLLPSRQISLIQIEQKRKSIKDYLYWFFKKETKVLDTLQNQIQIQSPQSYIKRQKVKLNYINQMLKMISPGKLLKSGFALIKKESGQSIESIEDVKNNDNLIIKLKDGEIYSIVRNIKKGAINNAE